MSADNTLRYVQFDLESHRNALLQRIKSRWPLAWTDFLSNNFGRLLVDIIAWSTCVLAYVINRLVAENFIPTMTLRESAVRLGAFFSYKLRNPTAAVVMCEAEAKSALSSSAKLSRGTSINVQLQSSNVIFELDQDYTIEAGKKSPEVTVLIVDPYAQGDDVINTQFKAITGEDYLDLVDSTIDLASYVEKGLKVLIYGDAQSPVYEIISVSNTPTSVSNSRIYIDRGWEGDSEDISIQIVDRRVKFVQGQTFVESAVTPTTEQQNYVIPLARAPIIEDSVQVFVNGTLWPTVYAVALRDKDDQVVEHKILPNGKSTVLFGDGVFGAIPPLNASVIIQYRVGGGANGNVETGTINSTVIAKSATSQIPITITNNSSSGQGGADMESLSDARNNIPVYVNSNDRAVTAADYEILASRFSDQIYGQVRYARAVPGTANSLVEGNIVTVYAWTTGPTGGLAPLSAGLKNSLLEHLKTKTIGTDHVIVADGQQKPCPIAVRFKIYAGFNIAEVETNAKLALSDIVNSVRPGEPIVFSDMVRIVDGVTGIDVLTVATPISDLVPSSAIEIFTPPDDSYAYEVSLKNLYDNTYESQLITSRLTPWCFKLFSGSKELQVIPDSRPGFARIYGDGVSDGIAGYSCGLESQKPAALTSSNAGDFWYSTDTQTLYKAVTSSAVSSDTPTVFWQEATDGGSYVDLNTGRAVISFKGAKRTVTMKLITAQGYDSTRVVPLFISYTGDNSISKRREIRAAIKTWAEGIKIGSSLYTSQIKDSNGNVIIAASRSNLTDVVLHMSGVTGVNKITLDSPSNSADRLDASATEVLKIGNITINNFSD